MTAEVLTNPVDMFLLMSEEEMIPEGVIKELDTAEGAGSLGVRIDMVGEKMIFVSIANELLTSKYEDIDAFPYNIKPPRSS